MTGSLVELREVSVRRAGRDVLQEVDLAIEAGRSVALVGPSGSGKSTLLELLGGLARPDRGSVVRELPEERIGLVLQGHGLVSLLTAEENAAVPLQAPERPRLARGEVRRRAAAALAGVGLAGVSDHLVEALSGGQQQRVAVARALVTDPDLLLADEPTAALDAENREHVADLLFALPARGTALVVATHDRALAERADVVVHVESGRLRTG